MSQKNEHANIINVIREKLEKESKKILSKGGKITPYHIMEGLKDNDGDEGVLTCVGRLIQESLGDPKMMANISWIAFHFEFPGREFSYSERDMRNWAALRSDKQDLLNTIHKAVREKFHEIQDDYAPSILFPQISAKRSENTELVKKFRERWWLYRLTDNTNDYCPCLNNDACRSEKFKDMEIIFFEEREVSGGKAARLTFCPPAQNTPKTFTLGDLLNEPEEESLRKFHNFKQIVRHASDGQVSLNCDFYARVPMFFRGTEQEYMTDIFVALSHFRENGEIVSRLEVDETIQILGDIIPSLKSCVSLINSQVAYSLGEVTRRDKMAGLLHAVIRHDINNFAAAVDGSISQLMEYWDIFEKSEAHETLKEIRANITLSTMCIDLDFLWNVNVKDDIDNFIQVSRIRSQLDKSWQFTTVSNCEFNGDWESDFLVPKVYRIILSNLIRNAINHNDNAEIRVDCHIRDGKVCFGCLSEKEFSEIWRRQAFEAPLPLKIPVNNRGLWICRYVVESLGGEFYLAPGQGKYKANVRFDMPIF